jgi:prophage regulatory protein
VTKKTKTHPRKPPKVRALVPISGHRLLTRDEVLDRVGVTYPTIWKWMRENKFPRSRQCGEARVGWLESEVSAWIAGLPIKPIKGDSGRVA